MKKLLISLVLLIPFVSGCADIDTRVNINDDKSASVVTSLTYEGNLNASNGVASTYKNFLDKYYKIDMANSSNLSTITAVKSVNNLEKEDLDLSSLGFQTKLASKKFIEIKKNFFVKSFNVDLVYDYPSISETVKTMLIKTEASKPSGLVPEYYQKYADSVDDIDESIANENEYDMAANIDDSVKQLTQQDVSGSQKLPKKPLKEVVKTSFSIQVPSFASYNNADSVVGNIYTWEVKTDEPTEIKLQYVRYSGFAVLFIILIGILILIIISKKILKRDSQKRMDNIENIV